MMVINEKTCCDYITDSFPQVHAIIIDHLAFEIQKIFWLWIFLIDANVDDLFNSFFGKEPESIVSFSRFIQGDVIRKILARQVV